MSTDWLLIIISLVLSAFFSGMEIAFVSSSRLKHELDMKKQLKPARILSAFYTNPSRFIGALLFGNNVSLVIYGTAMAHLLKQPIENILPLSMKPEFLVLLIQTILATLLILVAAEFIPKALFRIRPYRLMKTFAVPIWLFYYLFYPIIILYIGISELILKGIFRVRIAPEGYIFSAIDLNEYVQDLSAGEDPGQPLNQEIQMIQNAMDFKHVKLRDCMVPRPEIVALEIGEAPEVLRRLFTETGHSKIMIYEQSIDNILGYVHAYDMFTKPGAIIEVLRKVEIFPETTTARKALSDFIIKHKSVAVVVDEFGGTSGMITMEDIIEEIFGEIEDEYDVKEEVVEKKISEKEFIFSARLEIDYLNDKYNLRIPESEEYETLAGFILHHFESIPAVSDQIEIAPFLFQVLQASENKLEEVKLTIL